MGLFDSTRTRRWKTAHHEARHLAVARIFGATNLEGYVAPDGNGGYFTGEFDGSKEQEAVILMAGGSTRDGSGIGAGVLPHGDDSDLTQVRSLLHGSDMTVADAEREAERLVRQHRPEINRTARDLLRENT